MEAHDRKPERPAQGGRGSWSYGPIARVSPSTRPSPATSQPEPAPPPARGVPGRQQPGRPGSPGYRPLSPPARGGFGLPNLRRNVCPHFYMTGSRGAIPIQAPHLLKALIRQDANISRCQLRGGVHMDQGFVNDVCLTPRFNQCVFYEDELSRE